MLFDRFASAAKGGDDQALAMLNRELVRNRDQLAKLNGLYQPDRVDHTHTVQTTASILADARERLLAIDTIDAEVIE